jgi:hypothetical protein
LPLLNNTVEKALEPLQKNNQFLCALLQRKTGWCIADSTNLKNLLKV